MPLLLSCPCLNVQLNVRGSLGELRKNQVRHPQQLPDTPDHPFFTKELYEVELGVCGVTSEVDELTSNSPISTTSPWNLFTCLCCGKATHAVHKETQMHVASTDLLTESDMTALLQHERYSPVFHLVLPAPTTTIPTTAKPTHSAALLPQPIQKQFSQYLQSAEQATENRIAQYRQQQQQQLSKDTDKAKQDGYAMLALLQSLNKININKSAAAKTADSARLQQQAPQSGLSSVRAAAEEAAASWSTAAARNMTGPASAAQLSQSVLLIPHLQEPVSVRKEQPELSNSSHRDEHDLFHFDEDLLEERQPQPPSSSPSSCSTTDDDDYYLEAEDEHPQLPADGAVAATPGYSIPQSGGSGSLGGGRHFAQSVPIKVPNFGPRPPQRRSRPRDAQKVARTSEEIAASILAISKSLHFETEGLFSELPQPRKQSVPHTYYNL